MKKMLLLLSILLGLAACAPVGTASTSALSLSPTATLKPIDTLTATAALKPTYTLAATPSNTETMTATQSPEFSQDLEHPEKSPKITLDDLTSRAFATKFLVDAAAGKFPKAPSTAKPLPIEISYTQNPGLIAIEGYASMLDIDLKKAAAANDNISDLSQRPNYVAAIYQVSAPDGEIGYAVIMGYVNPTAPDGFKVPDGYWGYILLPHLSTDISQELTNLFPGNDPAGMTVPTYIANKTGANNYFEYFGQNVNSAFVTWYFNALAHNQELVLPTKTMTKWQQTDNLDNTITGEPLIPFSFVSIQEEIPSS